MKGILEFDLEDFTDRVAFKRASNATNAYLALYSFANDVLRQGYKYGYLGDKKLTETEVELFDQLKESFYKTLKEYDVDLNNSN